MTSFVIKIIAICSMFCDHLSDSLIGHFTFLNVIGRIAFPLFAFQIVIGYKKTSNVKKYLTRLLIFAIISQIPFQVFITNYTGERFNLNIFFTLACGLISLIILNKNFTKNKVLNTAIQIMLTSIICILSWLLNFDYKVTGILTIILIYYTYPCDWNEDKKTIEYRKTPLLFLGAICLSLIEYGDILMQGQLTVFIQIFIASLLPIFIMLAYNGEKGKSLKYFFYAFYPVHLIILDLISLQLND